MCFSPWCKTILRSINFNTWLLTLGARVARDTDAARVFAVAVDVDAEGGRGQAVAAHALGPLDDDDGALVCEQLVQLDGVRRAVPFGEAVEVEVVEDEPPFGVPVDESERRA